MSPIPPTTNQESTDQPIYKNVSASIAQRVEDLLSRMTLEEKIGQMTQVEKNSISPEEVARYFIGSILSGGGSHPPENTAETWAEMTDGFQEGALQTRLGIPILYGADAVHGHNNVYGATIFPHNIGLGAANDPDLVYRIGRATAEELKATGVHWNFAPTVAVPQDIRWGRTYEGFSEDTGIVTRLGAAYVRGLQGYGSQDQASILANPKHYLGDGATLWGSSPKVMPANIAYFMTGVAEPRKYWIDRGDVRVDEATMREKYLPPYIAALGAGAKIVMASFSSWKGVNMHANRYWLTDVLKGELGFDGFVITDWAGIDEIMPDYYQAVVTAINAGIDMSMVPMDYPRFISVMNQAIKDGDIALERVDDAVRRILRVKIGYGLFENPFSDSSYLPEFGSREHRALAREAAAKSMVLLKNEGQVLPLSKSLPKILIAGQGADDIGLQCGGWTIEWMGKPGPITPGVTILEAIRKVVSPETEVSYNPDGVFEISETDEGRDRVGIVVLSEEPYAEGFGDQADLSLSEQDIELIERVRQQTEKLVVILLSGRPLILTDQLPQMDALIAAWLPGSEGQGVVDVLFGERPFIGKLPYTWPRSMDQVPLSALQEHPEAQPLFPFGFGLTE